MRIGARIVVAIGILILAFALPSCSRQQSPAAVGSESVDSTPVAPAESAPTSQAPRALVRSIGGISLGWDDAQLTQALGDGLFTDAEGHVGARYFTDSQRTVTLHVVVGAEGAIDTIELSRGISIGKGMSRHDARLSSLALSSSPSIDQRLRLGARRSEVIALLGPPKTDKVKGARRVIGYEADGETDSRVGLYYEAQYSFVNDKLVHVRIYDGE